MVERRAELEGDLLKFVEAAWPVLDTSPFQKSWAIDSVCEHLQAVTEGQIRKLLINLPPRSGKTLTVSVCFPAWTWARAERSYLSGPQVRFLCGSYNDDLSLQNGTKHRRLLLSPWYQKYWGKRFKLTADQASKSRFDTTEGGTRISTSARGSLLGIGGDLIIVDDPHNLSVESEAERQQALNWWREISTTRLNDPKQSGIVVVMQRLHELDVSGAILSSDTGGEFVHLMIPAEYEWRRHCVTVLGWQDPRGLDDKGEPLITVVGGERMPRDAEAANELDRREGTLMWPERFGVKELAQIKAELGPYFSSGRLQQSPVPAKGGIFDRSWWQLYEDPANKFPLFEHIVASLDSAFTEKQQNDPSALTIWGVWTDKQRPQLNASSVPVGETRQNKRVRVLDAPEGWDQSSWLGPKLERRRIMLIHAWRKHLPFSGPRIEKAAFETPAMYKQRTQGSWGLMEWVVDTCTRFKVDKLLIEAKASGISAAQELRNRFGTHGWAIEAVPVKGDKVARALSVQPMFSQGYIYAPNRDWADLVISEMATFPMGRYDDLTDFVPE
jgi:predicted phage terminase large subunit-like protein